MHNLPVFTEAGQALGHLRGWEMHVESHSIAYYIVKPSGIARMLADDALRIAPTQVVAITKERMVVVDAAAGEPATRRTAIPMPLQQPEPALSRVSLGQE
jgi:sporulation protein YlmC with PRC-barrel domain